MTRAVAVRGFLYGAALGLAFYAGHVLSLALFDDTRRRW